MTKEKMSYKERERARKREQASAEYRYWRYMPQTISFAENRIKKLRAVYEKAKQQLEDAEAELEELLDIQNNLFKDANEIVRECCFEHDILYSTLLSRSRRARVVECRSEVCYRLMMELRMGTEVIGNMIERDHATVLYLASRWAALNNLPQPTKVNHYEKKMAQQADPDWEPPKKPVMTRRDVDGGRGYKSLLEARRNH